ncbi:YcxB family protein [Luteibacter aegosomatissinici]|uniref:YcxB family protein n=1 Tax=Luteibacter aegosomatissinici TaxID=2911539 RepID=UPI001FFB2D67|nr:YcxB family protein [Luteibacter aegosomatissinici]UPG94666.1 YcxB family protein [Luteibacter aegosomatissinici]
MEDVLVIESQPTLPTIRRSMIGMYRWTPGGKLLLAGIGLWLLIFLCFPQGIRHAPLVPAAIGGFVVSMLAMSVWMSLKSARQLFNKTRSGGPLRFTATPLHMRCDFDGDSLEVTWKNVERVCVSAHTVYVFIGRNTAWLIPRSEHEARLLEFARAANVRVLGA